MEPQPDFRELLRLFEEHDVDYLVVGAYALAFYGVPRDTQLSPDHQEETGFSAIMTVVG